MKCIRYRRERDEEGFTLIEMMVSLTMFAILSTALAGVFYASLRTDSSTTQRSKATALATKETEALKAIPYDTVGFYGDQAGYSTSFESRSTVTLASATPSGTTPLTTPAGSTAVGPTTFTISRNVVWADTAGASSTDPLLMNVNFGADQSVSSGTFTIAWAADGVGKVTVA